jgi:hypothetical protein
MMKNILFFLIPLLIVFPQPHFLAQIDDITRLPFQNITDTLFESAPVVLSENEAIIFYVNATQDTIFSTTSRDGGNNWEIPNALVAVELATTQSYTHLTVFRSSSGRILVAWAVKNEGMLIYSENNGVTWSQPQIIVSVGIPAWNRTENLNLSQLDDGRIILGFNDRFNREIYFFQSSDDGVTWSEEVTEVYSSQSNTLNGLTVVSSSGENLLAVFEAKPGTSSGIYKLISTDNGLTWGDTIKIVNTGLNESRPKIVKRSDGSLILTFLRKQPTEISDFNQDDIYYMISSDGGETWQEERRFTKYIGNDDFINISHLNGKTFISFASQRFTNNSQISYGILEETVENFTPPYLYNYSLLYQEEGPTAHTAYRAMVIDDDVVQNVEVSFEGSSTTTKLYDDGLHDDLEPKDNVWGNIFTADPDKNKNTYLMSVNKIILPFSNKGVLADTRATVTGPSFTKSTDTEDNSLTIYTPTVGLTPSLGKYDEISFLFSSGFGLSGYNLEGLWANAQMSSALIENFAPGKVGADPEDPQNVIYVVNSSDPPFGDSWQRWNDAVLLGADFYDGDKDGIYNPVDKNWNGNWDPTEDMPDLLGDETTWCVYNDGQPGNERGRFAGVEPQGIEIQQTMFASSLPELEDVIFLRYKITNRGTVAEALDSVIFGFMADPDLGQFWDDLVGCDTLLSSGVCYNNGEDELYGINPPAFYTTLLQGPIVESQNPSDIAYDRKGILIGANEYAGHKNQDIISSVNFNGSDPTLGVPNEEYEMRHYMKGLNRFGNKLDPCNHAWSEVHGGVDCSKVNPLYWYSGDPVEDIGWLNAHASDKREMLSVGEFTLEKDKPVTIIGAYVLGRGTDHLNSITVARENVRRAILEYESNFASLTYDPGEPANPVIDYKLYHNYPNPFNPTTTIRYEMPQDGIVTIKLYDILGQEVTTILNEFKKADRYEVEFSAIGLASGVYIYRMKVNEFFESKKMILLR